MAMASMFRRRKDQGLPTTANGSSASSPSVFSNFRHNPHDGSARNIRLDHKQSLARRWKQASFATRATYGSLLFFALTLYLGIRSIRYSNAYIHLNCRLESCHLQIVPLGWGKKLRVDFPRRQLLQGVAVKTDANGNFVEGTPNVQDDYLPPSRQPHHHKKNKKHSTANKQSTKGPDANGHYVSYALVLTDQDPNSPDEQQQQQNEEDADSASAKDLPIKDLKMIADYLEPLQKEQSTDGGGDNTQPQQQLQQYRLILRKFRIGQSKRRVRTILSKIDAYIKRRRTQLVVKETSPPAWQGILGVVLGLMGLLLSLLIGQLWDDDDTHAASGPGVRRESKSGSRGSSAADPMKRTTPARYEVATSSHPQRNRLAMAAKRNTTTMSQRDKIKQPWGTQ